VRVALILRLLDQAYDHKAWHGTTLRGSLRGVSAEQAAWRPGEGRHNIWELAVHAAYWKYTVLRRIEGMERGSFPLEGSNWFTRPVELSEKAWKADLRLLQEMHEKLRAAVGKVKEAELEKAVDGGKILLVDLLLGIAAHDLYHAGQVQLVKRLGGGCLTG
jgi:hypothetical protein